MKQRGRKSRLLSLVLSLVLAVGLLPGLAMRADADGSYEFNYAYDCQRSPAYPSNKKNESFVVKSFDKPIGSSGSRMSASHFDDKTWTLSFVSKYGDFSGPSTNLTYIVGEVNTNHGIKTDDVEIYELKLGGDHIAYGAIVARDKTDGYVVFIGDSLGEGRGGAGYVLSDTALSTASVTFGEYQDATDLAGTSPHTHSWHTDSTGEGTPEAKATITCTGTGECTLSGASMEVSLKASNVTLPGDVFNVSLSVIENAPPARPRSAINFPLTVTQTPGYKYSSDGSNFQEIDPQTFTPKPGIYQASVAVWNGNEMVANPFVKYTVSNPAVTAATGDNRPIELMLVGLTAFTTMAAVAFLLDSRRKARF